MREARQRKGRVIIAVEKGLEMSLPEANSPKGMVLRHTMRGLVRLPEPVRRRLFGEPPTNDRGDALDEQLHVMLKILSAGGDQASMEDLTPQQAREVYRRFAQILDLKPCPMESIEDRAIAGPAGEIPVRIYRPRPGRLPAVVFYHGGGFVVGCPHTYEGFCTNMAKEVDAVVISVDYRLAPEHAFPAGLEDALAAYRWVLAQSEELDIDPSRVAVAGDSAGATLAAVVSQRQIEDGEPRPIYQLLIYPKTDSSQTYPSYEVLGEGFMLSEAMLEWFGNCYVPDPAGLDAMDPRLSPLHFPELEKMPATTVVTAGFDPLRDEGEAYVEKLEQAGVSVRHLRFEDQIHGLISLGGAIDSSMRAVLEIFTALKPRLHPRD